MKLVVPVHPIASILRRGSLQNPKTWLLDLIVFDLDTICEVGDFVPAAIFRVCKKRTIACLGVYQIPNEIHYFEVPKTDIKYATAAVNLAVRQFASALVDRSSSESKVKWWMDGTAPQRGFIPDTDRLRLLILNLWPYWQSDAFKALARKKAKKESAERVSTLLFHGFSESMSETNLNQVVKRMGLTEKRVKKIRVT